METSNPDFFLQKYIKLVVQKSGNSLNPEEYLKKILPKIKGEIKKEIKKKNQKSGWEIFKEYPDVKGIVFDYLGWNKEGKILDGTINDNQEIAHICVSDKHNIAIFMTVYGEIYVLHLGRLFETEFLVSQGDGIIFLETVENCPYYDGLVFLGNFHDNVDSKNMILSACFNENTKMLYTSGQYGIKKWDMSKSVDLAKILSDNENLTLGRGYSKRLNNTFYSIMNWQGILRSERISSISSSGLLFSSHGTNSCVISKDSKTLYENRYAVNSVYNNKNFICIWDLVTKKCIKKVETEIHGKIFLSEETNQLFLVASSTYAKNNPNLTINIFNSKTGELVREISDYSLHKAVCFYKGSIYLANLDKLVKLDFDEKGNVSKKILKKYEYSLLDNSILIDEFGMLYVCVCEKNGTSIEIYDTELDNKLVKTTKIENKFFRSFCLSSKGFNRTGRFLIIAFNGGIFETYEFKPF